MSGVLPLEFSYLFAFGGKLATTAIIANPLSMRRAEGEEEQGEGRRGGIFNRRCSRNYSATKRNVLGIPEPTWMNLRNIL